MAPQEQFCPNMECPARGKVGEGNIGVHSQKERRYICHKCGKTFSETHGTALYGLKKRAEVFVVVVTLLAYGCPVQAIVAAFGLDERTVADWQRRAGQQAKQVHEHIVQQGQLDVEQVQADEIRVKKQGGIVWMATAIMVRTRLWLGGVVSHSRDKHLIRALADQVRSCISSNPINPILVAVDGLSAYVKAFRRAFRSPLHTGKVGRPRLIPWPDVAIVQIVKRYRQRRVVAIERRIVQGGAELVNSLLEATQGGGVINTAFIERLNATFRERLTCLVRRTRALARSTQTLTHAMYLLGGVYNFCRYHCSLRLPALPETGQRWLHRSPAMAAGLSDHLWSVLELMSFRAQKTIFPRLRNRLTEKRQEQLTFICEPYVTSCLGSLKGRAITYVSIPVA